MTTSGLKKQADRRTMHVTNRHGPSAHRKGHQRPTGGLSPIMRKATSWSLVAFPMSRWPMPVCYMHGTPIGLFFQAGGGHAEGNRDSDAGRKGHAVEVVMDSMD